MSTDVLPAAAGGMSSVAIAQVTGKQHRHVMRDIRALLEQGVNQSNFGLVEYTDAKGEKRPCYQLTRKGCLILASGYNALLREKIIDRLEELELARQKTLPSEAFAALEERVRELEASVRGLRPSGDVGAGRFGSCGTTSVRSSCWAIRDACGSVCENSGASGALS